MIISRTPLRISFIGGGTDYPQWYKEHGGAVLATSINKYCYVMMHNGTVSSTFDLPTKSGMATSSAYTVGLLRVCTDCDKLTISKLATVWESDKLGGNIGSQDQYVCSMGGFHLLRFDESGIRDTLIDTVKPLEKYLMLFDTHQYRMAGSVVAHQLEEMGNHTQILLAMMNMVDEGLACIKSSNWNLFGRLLHEAWLLKRQLSNYVTTPKIDAIYEAALRAGALGGKLLGAGGGGFMLFFTEPDKQDSVKNTLDDLSYVPFEFEDEGTKIIYKD